VPVLALACDLHGGSPVAIMAFVIRFETIPVERVEDEGNARARPTRSARIDAAPVGPHRANHESSDAAPDANRLWAIRIALAFAARGRSSWYDEPAQRGLLWSWRDAPKIGDLLIASSRNPAVGASS